MEIGKKLRQFRGRTRLSQKEIAEKLEVAVSTYNSWESDFTEPKISHLIKLAEIYDKEVTEFLEYHTRKTQTEQVKLIQHLESQISSLYAQLKDKEEIIGLLKNKIM